MEQIKDQICDVCHKMWQLGWVAANDGNVSALLDDNTILTTPTGMSKSFITPEKLIRVDRQGNVLEAAGGLRPSSELKMHLRCYDRRDDVRSVIHAHPPGATGFAVAHKAMDMYNMIEDVAAIGAVPLTPYGTPSTMEVPDAIEPYLQEHDVMLLENHGALAVGSDVITAFYRMESLELWAKITINAVILGGSRDISRENIQKLIDLRSFYRITGRHPGYKVFNPDDGLLHRNADDAPADPPCANFRRCSYLLVGRGHGTCHRLQAGGQGGREQRYYPPAELRRGLPGRIRRLHR